MAGYDLPEGQYDNRSVSEDELWSAISNLFLSRIRTQSSYKYGLMKAILDNIYNVDDNLMLTFVQVFSKFAEIYWNLILKHHLSQQIKVKDKKGTYLEQILHAAAEKYKLPKDISYENLTPTMMMDINHQVKQKCKTYVVRALYEDTKMLFYSFSKRKQIIEINPQMYMFICKHKIAIEKLNYYEWVRFLESVNKDYLSNNLLTKIDESAKRKNLTYYRNILFKEFENKCFYCGKSLGKQVDVDHFIPWSFIKDGSLWNMVLACPKCNRSKSDKLAEKKYLDMLVIRNRHIIIERNDDIVNYKESKLRSLYYWAQVNGYSEEWKPRKE